MSLLRTVGTALVEFRLRCVAVEGHARSDLLLCTLAIIISLKRENPYPHARTKGKVLPVLISF